MPRRWWEYRLSGGNGAAVAGLGVAQIRADRALPQVAESNSVSAASFGDSDPSSGAFTCGSAAGSVADDLPTALAAGSDAERSR